MNRIVEDFKQRRGARRWQRWTEVDPMEEFTQRSRIGVAVAFGLFVLLVAALVLALVPR